MSNSIDLVQALTLGVVQGLTEFLPISSTAHLRVVPALMHWQDPGAAFSAVIQLGSVAAVLAYFARDIVSIATGALAAFMRKDLADKDFRLAGAIAVGTVPIVVIGLAIKGLLEADDSPLRSFYVIGGAAIFMGILLLVAERASKHQRDIEEINGKDGLLVGLGQAMALIPGCSRSGSTLTVAMLLNMKRADAARFSFLLGIPAILASGLLELKHMLEAGLARDQNSLLSLIAGLISSFVVSYLSIAWLIKYLQTHATWIFVGYRIIFGITIIALAACKMI
ncbi:MAG: undecaprenyl-diphosphate phosphatase [Candidatus Obscuribacterales bacterium]|nr:undecaprenyl-diphosphate phosphatase [Candidatus Obscuribacterales bacterium]